MVTSNPAKRHHHPITAHGLIWHIANANLFSSITDKTEHFEIVQSIEKSQDNTYKFTEYTFFTDNVITKGKGTKNTPT